MLLGRDGAGAAGAGVAVAPGAGGRAGDGALGLVVVLELRRRVDLQHGSMNVFQIPAGKVPPATGSPWNSVFIGWNFFG